MEYAFVTLVIILALIIGMIRHESREYEKELSRFNK